MFWLTFTRVLIMLAYAVPGFILIKTNAVKPDAIAAFAKVLAYVCSPCLIFYTYSQATYTHELNGMFLMAFFTGLVVMFGVMVTVSLVLKSRFDNVRWRVFTIATVCGNTGFFGIPLLEALLPDHPDALIFSEAMSLSMNIVIWTYGMFVISQDKKYIKPVRILLVPNVIATALVYPMFILGWTLPAQVTDSIVAVGKMATPLCMIILGMRLATTSLRKLLKDWRNVLASLVKMVVFPLVMLAVTSLLPFEPFARAALFLVSCAPCASMVLTIAEMRGVGTKPAADVVLIAMLLSILAIPVMVWLVFPLIGV